MQPAPLPLTQELVLIGGGHAHALVLRMWGMNPLPGVRVTVIDPNPSAPYTGMLPGHIAGHYALDALEIDLVKLARFAGARLILGGASALDRDARLVHVPGRPPVPYDALGIDIGISSAPLTLDGFAEHGVPAKPLGPYADRWRAFLADGGGPVTVIGGGVGGVELAMAMAHALTQAGHTQRVTLLERDHILPGIGDRARATLRARLSKLGVDCREGASVGNVTADTVTLSDGNALPSALTVGAAGARPQAWLADTGLDLTDGYVTVGPDLQSVNTPGVFATGDCAHLSHAPRPKAGVFAVREAPILYRNLRAVLAGHPPPKTYRPQRDYMKLISLGDRAALLDKHGLSLSGRWLWRWKDRIDRRFMRKFHDLPAMPPPPLPAEHAAGMAEALGDKPACGGCGAKVSGTTLARVLAQLPTTGRPDVETQPGDDAAVLAIGGTRQVITTDHLRAFTEDPYLQTRIAAVHALGDAWAMGAKPQAALAQIILPRMAPALQDHWLAEVMAAAGSVFAEAGAEIVGGHTSLGTELTVGFTVTGLCDRAPITLAGARAGDALVLTKPIGSGTVLAGEMQMKAQGRWVMATLDQMARPQADAAAVLAGAHAMTDVTGFGLAGHLLAICDASNHAAELDLDAIPLLPGAVELAEAGIRSTLYPGNRALADRISVPWGAKGELLFAPQTAGGLLAAIPADTADDVLHRLRDAGHPAARIGRMVPGAPFVTVT